jgi:protein O-mannosyl-transferase
MASSSKAERRASPRALAVLVLLAGLVFSPVLTAGYLRLDDYTHILDNPSLAHLSASGLAAIWRKSYFGLYIPVTYSVWWIYVAAIGAFRALPDAAPLLHGLNLALHALNVVLVFGLLRTLLRLTACDETRARRVALLAALCFAVHPAQVETVSWISELKGALATTFGLLGIGSYYRSSRKVLTAACFVAAMLAKPLAIVLPGVLVLVDRILLGKSWKESTQDAVFFWVPLLPLAVVTKRLQPDLNLTFVPSLPARLVVAADAFSFYLGKLVFPVGLALDYGRSPAFVLEQVSGWRHALSALVLVAAALAAGYALWRPPRAPDRGSPWRAFVLCGWAIFCLALCPVLGLVPFELQDLTTVADHYLYLPLLGGSLILAGLLLWPRAAVRAPWVAAGVLLAFAVLSFVQTTRWRSTESLFRHTLRINPRSYVAHYSMAAELLAAGRTEEGIAEARACLAQNPDYLPAQVALGAAWLRQGQFQTAADHYLGVLATSPKTAGKRAPLVASLHNNLGMALARLGRGREAIEHFARAVAIDPQSVTGHFNLGLAASALGKHAEAMTHYQAAAALSPGNSEIQQQLAAARRRAQPP